MICLPSVQQSKTTNHGERGDFLSPNLRRVYLVVTEVEVA